MSTRATRTYLFVLMGGVLVQGLGSLLFRTQPELAAGAPYAVRGVFGIDFSHSWIHITWGVAGLVVLLVFSTARAAVNLALAFGVFYTAFGVLGVTAHHPLGLELDLLENGFHLIAGPLTLLIGLLGIRRLTGRPRAAARPDVRRAGR